MTSRKSRKDLDEQAMGRAVKYLMRLKYDANGPDRADMDMTVLDAQPDALHDAVRRIGEDNPLALRQLDMFIEDDLFTTDWASILTD